MTYEGEMHMCNFNVAIIYSEMFCISSAPPDKIMTVHNISCVVAAIFATDIIGDAIPIKKS
jgi:hypothetical protein